MLPSPGGWAGWNCCWPRRRCRQSGRAPDCTIRPAAGIGDAHWGGHVRFVKMTAPWSPRSAGISTVESSLDRAVFAIGVSVPFPASRLSRTGFRDLGAPWASSGGALLDLTRNPAGSAAARRAGCEPRGTAGPSHAPPPPCAGRIMAGSGAPDVWNRGFPRRRPVGKTVATPRIGGEPSRAVSVGCSCGERWKGWPERGRAGIVSMRRIRRALKLGGARCLETWRHENRALDRAHELKEHLATILGRRRPRVRRSTRRQT